MAIARISPIKYGKLLTTALPKVIETRKEFDRYVAIMEQLDRRAEKGETLSPEENTLLALLERLIQDYDDRIELPAVPPLQMLLYLMEQRGLRQADLVPIFGSRSVASDVLNGKREFSKAHIPPLKCFYNRSETTAATRKRRARTIAWASGPSSISMGFHSPAWSSD